MGCDIHGVWQAKREGEWVDIESTYEQHRHYQLFAVLAGVRNGTGFAGVRTGDPVVPIARPRGLPDDFAVQEDEYYAGGMWMGDHSHSWLSGAEMLAWYERAPIAAATGVIARGQFNAWDGTEPDEWSADISGPDILVIDTKQARYSSCRHWKFQDAWTHVRVAWKRPLAGALAYFFDEVRRLADEHGEIRFVFGFDS